MTIADLKPGEKGVIAGYLSSDPPSRLLEFGLLPDTPVKLVRFAPLGDPIEILVRGFHLSIRLSEAAVIELASTEGDES